MRKILQQTPMRSTLSAITALSFSLMSSLFISGNTYAAETRLVNLDMNGTVPDRVSIFDNDQTPDGRFIAFTSNVPYTGNPATIGSNVFVRDTATGTVEQVSVSSAGTPGNQGSREAAISNDGRYVAFVSLSNNLVEDDTNNVQDVFLHDRQTGQTIRVNEGPNGEQTTRLARDVRLSGDGTSISFITNATEILGINDNTVDMFLYDIPTGNIVSPNYDNDGNRRIFSIRSVSFGDNGAEMVLNIGISFDARHIGSSRQIYVYDVDADTFELVSVNTDDQVPAFVNNPAALSGDGRYVAFATFSRMVPEDMDNTFDIMVKDRLTGELWIASVNDQGEQIDVQPQDTIAISRDGQSVLFQANLPGFSEQVSDMTPHIYLYDHGTGKTELVSQSTLREPANANAGADVSISADGRYSLFQNTATNLDALSETGNTNLFRRDRGAGCGTPDAPLSVNLPPNQWFQLSMPCQPPADVNTLQDVLADDIPGEYADTWIVFVYEQLDGELTYRPMTLDEHMSLGQGFWFTHLNENSVTLDMPTGSRGPSTNLDAGLRCVSLIGCKSIALSGETVQGIRWNMVGNPFPHAPGVMFDNMRLSTSEGVCSAEEGCTLPQASNANVVFDTFFSWNGSDGGYDSISTGGTLEPWRAAWLGEGPGLVGLDPVIYVAE